MVKNVIVRCRNILTHGAYGEFLKGSFSVFLTKAGGACLSFGLSVILARTLGAESYGVYAFAFAVSSLLLVPAHSGVPRLVVREMAKAWSVKDTSLIKGLRRWADRAIGVYAALILLVGLLLLVQPPGRAMFESPAVLLLALVGTSIAAFTSARAGALRGQRQVVRAEVPQSILRPAILSAALLGWITFDPGSPLTADTAMVLRIVTEVLLVVAATVLLARARPVAVESPGSARTFPAGWRRAVIPLSMISGLQFINGQADLLVLGWLRSDEEVGVYRVVVSGAGLVAFGLHALNEVLRPYFSSLYADGAKAELQKLVTLSARLITLAAVPPVLAFLFFGDALLGWIFGTEYSAGYMALVILGVGQLVNAAMGSVGALLSMTGHENDTLRGNMVAATANLVLNMVLVPSYGIEGAAVATAATFAISNFYLYRMVRLRLGMESTLLGTRRAGADDEKGS